MLSAAGVNPSCAKLSLKICAEHWRCTPVLSAAGVDPSCANFGVQTPKLCFSYVRHNFGVLTPKLARLALTPVVLSIGAVRQCSAQLFLINLAQVSDWLGLLWTFCFTTIGLQVSSCDWCFLSPIVSQAKACR